MTTKVTPAVVDLPSYGFKNKIINGRMEVAQRGTGFNFIGDGEYSLDRWRHNQSGLATMNYAQSTDVPADQGLFNRLWINTALGDPTVNAGDHVRLHHMVDGY